MTRPKKGGGRHTPKQGGRPDAELDFGELGLDDRLIDPSVLEQAILDSTVDISKVDPNDFDLEQLGLGDVDPLEILSARLRQALEEGPGSFLDEASGVAWLLHDGLGEGERSSTVEMYGTLEEVGGPLMFALAYLGISDEVRSTADADAALRRAEVAPWLRDLGQATVSGQAIGLYEPDDEVEILAEVTIPGLDAMVVAITRSKVVHELLVDVSMIDERLVPLAADVNVQASGLEITMQAPQRVADELALSLTPTIEWAMSPEGLPLDNGIEAALPLAAWIARMLPAPKSQPFYGFEGEERDAALTRYLAEAQPTPSDDALASVGLALDYSVEQDPFRWTPQRIVNMFERGSSRIEDPMAMIGHLSDFLGFAATVHGDPPERLDHNRIVLDQVREHADELFEP